MIRRPPRSTLSSSSAASDVYKRQTQMSPVKIYAIPVSQPARAVLWACLATNTPYELIPTNPGSKKPNGTRHPDFLAKFPGGTVPSIDHDGYYLSESHAILTYLAETFTWESLYPSDPKTRGRIHELFNWHHTNTRMISGALFAPVLRPDLNIQGVEGKVRALTKVFERFETILSGSPFLAGSSPTIVDMACYCEISQCSPDLFGLYDLSAYPNINKWMEACKGIPGYQESHAVCFKMAPMIKQKVQEYKAKL
eukprot:TRINITY_DN18367_c0_g1_i1.p1 TRINITY_DN18367_c0_g1~~TRINITY_DN18367_c0_g1_i1.p1  ORF type:complete len:253 (-),score=43.96 TRINITY_DN18367_c0_g1_i1:270-1028(-)